MKSNKFTLKMVTTATVASMANLTLVYASEWNLSPSVEIGVIATDNLGLTNVDTQRDTVATIRPALEARVEGNRFNSVIRGEVEYYKFEQLSGEFIDPRLFARSNGDLIEGFLFLDARLSVAKISTDEVIVRPIDNQDADPILRSTDEIDHSLKIRLNPYINHSFGTFANLQASYRYQLLDESLDGTLESQRNNFDISLGRDPKFGGLLWGFGAGYTNDDAGDDQYTTSTLFGRLGSTIGQTLEVEVNAGIEKNDFENIAGLEDENEFVSGTITWTPSENTTLAVGYSDQFFGEGPTLSLKHETPKSKISASWDRGITRARASLDTVNDLANPTTGPNTGPGGTLTNNPNLNFSESDPFVENSLSLTYRLTGRRSNIRVDAVYSQQEELYGDATIDSTIGRIAFDRRLSPITTLRFEYSYLDSSSGERSELNYVENRFSVRANYTFP